MIKVTLNCTKQHIEAIENALSELGALSLVITSSDEQEIFEPELNTQPMWENCTLSALFDESIDEAFVRSECESLQEDFGVAFELSHEQEQDWVNQWRQEFHTMHFGERLVIHPSHELPETPSANAILLDPGLAFGTGKHPTTALCLEWLDAEIQGGETVVDYGCGSGILAIAASKLGAQHVLAVDLDPQALSATEDNCAKNQVTNVRPLLCEEVPAVQADVLVANILANPLISLAPTLAELVKSGGKLALSGILDHQADGVLAAYAPYFEMTLSKQREEWVLLTGIR